MWPSVRLWQSAEEGPEPSHLCLSPEPSALPSCVTQYFPLPISPTPGQELPSLCRLVATSCVSPRSSLSSCQSLELPRSSKLVALATADILYDYSFLLASLPAPTSCGSRDFPSMLPSQLCTIVPSGPSSCHSSTSFPQPLSLSILHIGTRLISSK